MDQAFIQITGESNEVIVLNVRQIYGVSKAPNGKASIWWASNEGGLKTLETFEDVVRAIEYATSKPVVKAGPNDEKPEFDVIY